jgi:hypothetical protein
MKVEVHFSVSSVIQFIVTAMNPNQFVLNL